MLRLDETDHQLGDAVLEVEDIPALALEAVAPKVRPGLAIDQLCTDPDLRAGATDAALQDIAHPEHRRSLAHVGAGHRVGAVELRPTTAKVLNRLSAVMRSSVRPSAKNPCSESLLRLANGITAITGLPEAGSSAATDKAVANSRHCDDPLAPSAVDPSAFRRAAICTVRLASSTIVPGQPASINAFFPTTAPLAWSMAASSAAPGRLIPTGCPSR